MRKYSIDDYTEFSNDDVSRIIQMIINNEIKEVPDNLTLKMFFISPLLKYITDETLLFDTLNLLSNWSWLKELKQVNNILSEKVLPNLIYTKQDCIKISAIVYSLLLEHEVNSKIIESKTNDLPTFEFKVKERLIFYKDISKDALNTLIDLTIKNIDKQNHSKSQKEDEYNKVIRFLHTLKRNHGTKFYNDNIKYLNGFKETIIQNENLGKVDTFKFENIFDKVKPEAVYNYFNKHLVEKGYLSKDDLEKYLLMAFQDKAKPKEKFTFSNLHIEKIRTIFYTYYKDIASNSYGKKELYAKLLGEYFKGFTTEKVKNNFADGYKLVRK